LAEGEAVWIGFRPTNPDAPLAIAATFALRRSGSPTEFPPAETINLVGGGTGLAIIWRFWTVTNTYEPILFRSRARHSECDHVDIVLRGSHVNTDAGANFRFRFCSHEEFTAGTGIAAPVPIENTTAYKGWLLP